MVNCSHSLAAVWNTWIHCIGTERCLSGAPPPGFDFFSWFAFYFIMFSEKEKETKGKENAKRQSRESKTSTRKDNDEYKTHKSVVSLTRL